MDLLPDDVLLEVLQYLDVPDLLACRRVCKRLGTLALAGPVWRHRQLRLDGYLPDSPLWVPPVYRESAPLHQLDLVPCLDHLHVCAAAGVVRALTTTKCAVASLTLEDSLLSFDSPLYVELVRHQEALGRLKRVDIRHHSDYKACGVLLEVLTTLPRLESLTCSNSKDYVYTGPSMSTLVHHVPCPSAPSLKKFSWRLTRDTVLFVHAMLMGHSSTLEDVELRVYSTTRWTETTIAPVLSALPKLHSLRINKTPDILLAGLMSVVECGTLKKLCVDIWPKDPTVVELLRQAKQLRDVRLQVKTRTELRDLVVNALASPALLERLELELNYDCSVESDVHRLLRVLPTLPALRHLVLAGRHVSYTRFLKGITPATAPALRILELNQISSNCAHNWVHKNAVHSVLISNPSLHVQLGFKGMFFDELFCQYCEVCLMDCHQNIWKAAVGSDGILKLSIHLHELQMVIS